MSIKGQYKKKLRDIVLSDYNNIKNNGGPTQSLGHLLQYINNEHFYLVVLLGCGIYEKDLMDYKVKGYTEIASLSRYVWTCCDKIFYRKSRYCGIFVDGIVYSDSRPHTAIVTWNEILCAFMWNKPPDFVFSLEKLRKE